MYNFIFTSFGILILSFASIVIIAFIEKKLSKKEEYKFDIWRQIVISIIVLIFFTLIGLKLNTESKLYNLEMTVNEKIENLDSKITASAISSSIIKIKNIKNPFLSQTVDDFERMILDGLSELEDGNVYLPKYKVFSVPTKWNDLAKKSINAVSFMPGINDTWKSSDGTDYFKSIKDAKERNIEIKRVFIFMNDSSFSSFMYKSNLITEHINLLPEGTRITLQNNVEKDFKACGMDESDIYSVAIFDEKIAGAISPNYKNQIQGITYKIKKKELDKQQIYFNKVWGIAVDPTNKKAMKNLGLEPINN